MQRVLEEVAEIKPYRRADQRPDQRACAADSGLHDQLAGRVEHESIRRHEALHDGEKTPGETGIGRSDHEGGELVAVNVMAERRRAQRVVAQRAQDRSHRRPHDAQRDDQADEIPERQEGVHRRVGVEAQRHKTEVEAGRRHARQAVLSAGEGRQGIELDEEEHLGDRHRDHGEVDPRAPEGDQTDKIADHAGNHRADHNRRQDIGKIGYGKQIRGEHAAGAEERRLTERQQARIAEQEIEAEPEQPPDQDAVDGGQREAEMRQHEGRGNQRDDRERFNDERTIRNHGGTAFTRGQPCRGAHRDGSPARASSPRKA